MALAKQCLFFGQMAVVVCDGNCGKAWGIHARPQVSLSDDPDDFAYLADGELGEAPVDPGDYEGGDAKPVIPSQRLNKWCVRACERLEMTRSGKATEAIEGRDFSRRLYNQPWKHQEPLPSSTNPIEE